MYNDETAITQDQANELIRKEKAKRQKAQDSQKELSIEQINAENEAYIREQNRAKGIMEDNGKLVAKSNIDNSKAIEFDSQAVADEMNTQARAEAQAQANRARIAEAEMYQAPDKVHKSYMQNMGRNTGIEYFDKKKNLTLMDAYIAKQLGLNTSYIYHRIDITSDNTNTNMNITHFAKSAKNNSTIAKNLIDNALISYAHEKQGKGGTIDGLKKKTDRTTRGLIEWGVNDLNAYQQKFERDTLQATYMTDDTKQITNYDKEQHKSYIGESFSTPARQLAYLATNMAKQSNAYRSNAAPLINNGKVKGDYKNLLTRDYELISQAQDAMNILAHSKSQAERDNAAALLVDIKGAMENYR